MYTAHIHGILSILFFLIIYIQNTHISIHSILLPLTNQYLSMILYKFLIPHRYCIYKFTMLLCLMSSSITAYNTSYTKSIFDIVLFTVLYMFALDNAILILIILTRYQYFSNTIVILIICLSTAVFVSCCFG